LSENESLFGRRDIIAVLKQLQELGVGQFITGRRGQPSRFEWFVAMISVGKAAKGDEEIAIEPLDDIEPLEEIELNDTEPMEGSIRHRYKLRQDYEVIFDFPIDLSTKEAGRLADFIRTLPFDEE